MWRVTFTLGELWNSQLGQGQAVYREGHACVLVPLLVALEPILGLLRIRLFLALLSSLLFLVALLRCCSFCCCFAFVGISSSSSFDMCGCLLVQNLRRGGGQGSEHTIPGCPREGKRTKSCRAMTARMSEDKYMTNN
jgi:hypothetical protein